MLYKKAKVVEEEISIVDAGCWSFGGDWNSMGDKKPIDIVRKAIDLGTNLFSMTLAYGQGYLEKVLGVAPKEGYSRDKILIISKDEFLRNDTHETTNDLSERSLMKEIDQTLTRLQTGHINIYQVCWPDPDIPLEEAAEALEEARRAGKIRYVGLSNFSQADVEKMIGLTQVHCQQSLYNMLECNTTSYHEIPLGYHAEEEVLPAARKHSQTFLPCSPLFQELLAGKFHIGIIFFRNDIRDENPKLVGPQFEQYFEIGERLKSLADEYRKPANGIALSWLGQRPEVTSIIGGASSIQQLEQDIHYPT